MGMFLVLPSSGNGSAVTWTQTTEADFSAGRSTGLEALVSGDLGLLRSGAAWTREGIVLNIGSPGALDDTHVRQPFVLKDGSVYRMWYAGGDGTRYRIMYATSNDGVAWSVRASPSLSSQPPGTSTAPSASSS